MSLLLDALKKAEKEKLKAREAEAASEDIGEQTSVQEEVNDGLSDEPDTLAEEALQLEDVSVDDELELTPQELEQVPDEEAVLLDAPELKAEEPSLSPPIEVEKIAATTSTVSDEALQLLIYKTNKRYRQNQKLVWGGLISATMIILMVAGTYYYFGMLEEVDALERKHKLAMRDVRLEPVKHYQVVEMNKAAAAESSDKEIRKSKVSTQHVKEKKVEMRPFATNKKIAAHNFSIEKTKTEDPVNKLLMDAWLAYNRADYSVASHAYENVLKREPKNRDAILGIAAVAMKSADYKKAKASYQLLLKLNPRDEVAMSAMTNIDKSSKSTLDESKLKFMLQQQPLATHLNFALGNLFAKQSRWPEAQSEYFKAWQGNSKNADYAYNLAVSLDQLGKPEEALRFYKDSLILATDRNIRFSKENVEKRIERISAK